jgi:hypothetical protein
MRATPEAIRKLFTLRHGERAFESIAKRYAEVAGDSSLVDLSTIPEWRDFAITIRMVPNGDVLRRAFLWCARHREPLVDLNRPTVPTALEKLEDPAILRQLFELFPFFIANSPNGFRCAQCFDAADRFTDLMAKSPNHSELQYLLARAESSTGIIASVAKSSTRLG